MINSARIKKFVDGEFNRFGHNKRQEITRLLFEICKREKLPLSKIARDIPQPSQQFTPLKHYLVRRRFPHTSENNGRVDCVLPELAIDPRNAAIRKKQKIYPKNIFIEKSVTASVLTQRLRNKFPHSRFTIIESYCDHVNTNRYSIQDYNNRFDNFFVIREAFDFFKKCPCSPKAVSCGYHIANIGVGCIYECAYCYIQEYINSPGIILPANIEDFFHAFKDYKKDIRIGSGEFTDSLALDHITGFSPLIIDFFRKHPKSTFEFKTKSDNVGLLASINPAGNIVVSWSVNPSGVVRSNEFFAASIAKRVAAARRCVGAGYRIGFHFDPIIVYEGWEKDYKKLINDIFGVIDAKRIAWISLGTLRMGAAVKKVIENRFPKNTLLDGELLVGFDGKLRYSRGLRIDIYRKMIRWLRTQSKGMRIYLCMEDASVWEECLGISRVTRMH